MSAPAIEPPIDPSPDSAAIIIDQVHVARPDVAQAASDEVFADTRPVQSRRRHLKKNRNMAKRRWKLRFFQKLASPSALFILATIIAPGLLLGARGKIVTAVPASAKIYAAVGLPVNLDGLELANVSSVLKTENGNEHLLIKGEIVNKRDKTGKLPNLQLALRGPDGRDLYNWQAPSPQKRIKARHSIRFVARLDSPPEGALDVFVRFARKGG